MYIAHALKDSIHGPWLLDKDAFKSLDALLDEKWKTLGRMRSAAIREEVKRLWELRQKSGLADESAKKDWCDQKKKELSDRYSHKATRKVTIKLKPGGERVYACFQEVIDDHELHAGEVVSFDATLEAAGVSCSISSSTLFGHSTVDVSAGPELVEEAKDIFNRLRGWAKDHQPSGLVRRWRAIFGTPVFSQALFLWMCWMLLGLNSPSALPDTKRLAMYEEARTIQTKGVDATNQHQAVALLLAFQTGYYPKDLPPPPPQTHFWQKYTFWAPVIFFAAMMAYPPRSIFGLTETGERRLHRKKAYLDFVTSKVVMGVVGVLLAVYFLDPLKALLPRYF